MLEQFPATNQVLLMPDPTAHMNLHAWRKHLPCMPLVGDMWDISHEDGMVTVAEESLTSQE